ncbi:hypothetical protein BASA83_013500, partial [Batrachochytrium salamandrivorans]
MSCVPSLDNYQSGYHPLTPITSEHPMDVIAMDTAKSFPTSPRGNNVLLVVICVFTRFIFLCPLQDNSRSSSFLCFSQSSPTLVSLVSSNQTMAQNSLRAIVHHLTTSFHIDHRFYTRITQGLMAWQSALFRPHVTLFVNFWKLNPFCDHQTDADFVTLDANALKERMVEMSSVLFPAIGNLSKCSVNKAQLAFIKKF